MDESPGTPFSLNTTLAALGGVIVGTPDEEQSCDAILSWRASYVNMDGDKFRAKYWCRKRDSNSRPHHYE